MPTVLTVAALGVALLSITSPAATARAGSAPASSLAAGATLRPGEFLTSFSGLRLTMQADGNLVLTNPNCTPGEQNCPYVLWNLGTAGQPGNHLTMQRDGNLVLYSKTGRVVWATMTRGTGNANVFRVQDDTNLVVYSGGRPVWASGTVYTDVHVTGREVGDLRSQNRRYSFGTPGNGMHVWDGGTPIWGVNCPPDPRVNCSSLDGRLVLQSDGNLVWYQPAKNGGRVAVWSSGTQGAGPTTNLRMQNDGNLVLYDLWHRPLWSSKSGLVRRAN
jgi:hypothetical protein